MRGHGLKALAAAALVAAVCVPAASARRAAHLQLALVPLQHAQLGAAGRPLQLQQDSGVVSNEIAAASATGNVSPKRLAKLGRITGYRLDYGDAFLSGSGIREIETGVEQYRSVAGAKHGLAFWRRDGLKTMPLGLGVHVAVKALHTPKVGAARWASVRTLTIPNASRIFVVDEAFREGDHVAAVSVAAGSLRPARKLAPELAKKVDARLRLGLAGKLRGRPAKLLPHRKPGPPSSGLDPASAALAISDFGEATLASEQYVPSLDALSEYDVAFAPADGFDSLFQEIVAESTPGKATYDAAVISGGLASFASAGTGGSGVVVTPVDLSSVGDDAYGALIQLTLSGRTIYEGAVVLVDGPLVDLAVGAAVSPVADSDVTSLAQAMATKLAAAVTG